MHIMVITTENRYQTTQTFAAGLTAALKRAGHQVSLFSAQAGGIAPLCDEIERLGVEATLSFSDISCAGQGLENFTQIPHFSYFLDPAIYFLHHRFSSVSCVDEGDVEIMRAAGCDKVSFLPVAIEGEAKKPTPFSERHYDCVYFGTCLDPEKQKAGWKQRYSAEECDLLEAMADVILTTPLSTWDVMRDVGVCEEKFLTFFHELDHYIRAQDRIELLRAVDPRRLTIWGDGPWARYIPKAKCHPALPFPQTLSLLSEAKFVLNSSPRFKRGIHERVFYALMAGSLPLSTFSPPLVQDYSEELTYGLGRWEEVNDRLDQLARRYTDLVTWGQHITLQKHHWDRRVSCLLKQWHCGQRVSA